MLSGTFFLFAAEGLLVRDISVSRSEIETGFIDCSVGPVGSPFTRLSRSIPPFACRNALNPNPFSPPSHSQHVCLACICIRDSLGVNAPPSFWAMCTLGRGISPSALGLPADMRGTRGFPRPCWRVCTHPLRFAISLAIYTLSTLKRYQRPCKKNFPTFSKTKKVFFVKKFVWSICSFSRL